AQERARLKAALEPGTKSVIEPMTASQLSSFAIFSDTKTFNQGQHILVEGDDADGFYILLSGHLMVATGGRFISELSEGDVSGDAGREGWTGEATLPVVSAGVEVLFMRRQNFRPLVRTRAAFAWEIWEKAPLPAP